MLFVNEVNDKYIYKGIYNVIYRVIPTYTRKNACIYARIGYYRKLKFSVYNEKEHSKHSEARRSIGKGDRAIFNGVRKTNGRYVPKV